MDSQEINAYTEEKKQLLAQIAQLKAENAILRNRDGHFKIASIGTMANLFNGAPGREPKTAARTACNAVDALFEEWDRRNIK